MGPTVNSGLYNAMLQIANLRNVTKLRRNYHMLRYFDLQNSIIQFTVYSSSRTLKYTGGVQKKVAPHQKWFTWIIMAINNQNVNKSNVFVFSCVAVCKPKQYL